MLHTPRLAGPGETDVRDVIHKIDSILASPAGQRDAVQSALQGIRSKLVLDNPLNDRIALAEKEFTNLGPIGAQKAVAYQHRNLLNKAARGEIGEVELTKGLQD
jgi:hypothetical protein